MNTQFAYTYRDASNWKTFEIIILQGEMSSTDMNMIFDKLYEGQFFIPEQVGLVALQTRDHLLSERDHIWHELDRDAIQLVDTPKNSNILASELVKCFMDVEWDLMKAHHRLHNLE